MAVKLKDLDYSKMNCSAEHIKPEKAIKIFFPEGDDILAKTEEARSICAGCPMLEQCFEVALQNDDWGIWGGSTRRERQYLQRHPREKARFFRALRSGKRLRLVNIKDENTLLQ